MYLLGRRTARWIGNWRKGARWKEGKGGRGHDRPKREKLIVFLRSFPSSIFFHSYSNTVRKSIARVLTVINKKQRDNLREFYKDAKCESSRSSSTFPSIHFSFSSERSGADIRRLLVLPLHRHAPRPPIQEDPSYPKEVVQGSLSSIFWEGRSRPRIPRADLRTSLLPPILSLLPQNESAKITEKQHKKNIHFPLRSSSLPISPRRAQLVLPSLSSSKLTWTFPSLPFPSNRVRR